MIIKYGSNWTQSDAFMGLSRRKRRKIKENVDDSLHKNIERLEDRIELPRKTTVRFIGSSCTDGSASGRVLSINTAGSILKHILKGDLVLDGLIAHEISHISDSATGNYPSSGLHRAVTKLVSEGKADQVGVSFGGGPFAEHYAVNRVDDNVMNALYPCIKRVVSLTGRIVDFVGQFDGTSVLPINYGITESCRDPAYNVGYTLVGDAMIGHNSNDILDIHGLPYRTIVNMAIQKGQGE